MDKPVRIQLKRIKGWRKPDNTIVVSRPGKFGNPFTIAQAIESGYVSNQEEARRFVVRCFDDWLHDGRVSGRNWWQGPESDKRRAEIMRQLSTLRGKNLACWCPLVDKNGAPVPCHADVLLELANGPALTAHVPG